MSLVLYEFFDFLTNKAVNFVWNGMALARVAGLKEKKLVWEYQGQLFKKAVQRRFVWLTRQKLLSLYDSDTGRLNMLPREQYKVPASLREVFMPDTPMLLILDMDKIPEDALEKVRSNVEKRLCTFWNATFEEKYHISDKNLLWQDSSWYGKDLNYFYTGSLKVIVTSWWFATVKAAGTFAQSFVQHLRESGERDAELASYIDVGPLNVHHSLRMTGSGQACEPLEKPDWELHMGRVQQLHPDTFLTLQAHWALLAGLPRAINDRSSKRSDGLGHGEAWIWGVLAVLARWRHCVAHEFWQSCPG